MTNSETSNNEKKGWRNFLKMGEVFGYFFRRKDPNRPSNINIKMMHGINKLAMLMFLICVLIILYRVISRNFF